MSAEHTSGHRWRWIALGAVLILLVAAFLIVKRALDPQRMRGLAESQLSGLLGQRVRVGAMSVSFVPPAVTGEGVRIGGAGAGSPAAGLQRLRVVPRPSSLLSARLVVDRIDLEGLALTIRRDPQGRWMLPFGQRGGAPPQAPSAPASPRPAAVRPAAPPRAAPGVDIRHFTLKDGSVRIADDGPRPVGDLGPAQITNIDADVRQQDGGAVVASLTATVGATKVTGSVNADRKGLRLHLASDSLGNSDLTTLLGLLGTSQPAGMAIGGRAPLELDIAVAPNGAMIATGTLGAERLTLDTLTLAAVEAPLRVEKNVIALDPLVFQAYNGSHRGRLTVDFANSPASWTLTSRLDGLDINQMLSANSSAKDTLLGVATIVANLQGVTGAQAERSLKGSIETTVDKGVIRNFPLLATLNSALRLTGGNRDDTEFERLTARLIMVDGVARTDNLELKAGEATIRASGSLGSDQSLNVRGKAIFTPAKSEEIIRSIHEFASMRNANGEVEVPIGVTGTVTDPQVSADVSHAVRAAIGKELSRGLGRLLKRIR